jgi:hypothetical protein
LLAADNEEIETRGPYQSGNRKIPNVFDWKVKNPNLATRECAGVIIAARKIRASATVIYEHPSLDGF